MKKLSLCMAFSLGVFLLAGTASAYTINDPSNDSIGAVYESFGIDVVITATHLNIDLYTKFDGANMIGPASLQWNTYFADLRMNLDGLDGYEHAFSFKDYPGLARGGIDTTVGLYENVTAYFTSTDHLGFDSSGGAVNYQANYPVTVKSGTEVNNYNFTSTPDNPVAGTYKLTISLLLGDLGPLADQLCFAWGTATCANDIVEGCAAVPEPATMLLLGTGLIGLAGLGRRKLFKG